MPSFEFQPNPVKLNSLLSMADLTAQQQGLQSNALALEAAQQKNAYTAAVQPAQINLLLQGLQGMSGGAPPQPDPQAQPQSAPASPDDDAPTAQPAAWQPPANGTKTLLSGDTPVSADADTQQLVGQVAARNNVNPDWAMRVHYAESGASPSPFGPGSTSSAGAIGPMQLMPATAKGLGVDPSDLQGNVRGGVAMLAALKEKYGNPVLATAAYNAGPGRVDDFLSGKGSLPGETLNYVGKVFGGNGVQLLQDAMNGSHGPVAGMDATPHGGMQQVAASGPSAIPGGGAEPQQSDAAARAATKRLVAMGQYYASLPGGTGARAAAQIQAQLDNIAGPGGIVDPQTGNVMRVPGSFATRYAAANASKAGESGPAAALYAQNEGVRTAGEARLAQQRAGLEQQTHAVNVGTDVAGDLQKPIKVAPSETLTTPAAVGVGGVQQGAALPSGSPPGGPQPMGAQPGTIAPQAGVYQARPNTAATAATAASTKEGDRTVDIQQPIMDQARESQNALNRIGQVRQAMSQASTAGIGPGKFAPELAQAAAAAKSLGIDLSSFGINPQAVQNEQVAREALTQINGEILKRMFPQRITNADVATFGSNLANYGMDPAALTPILNQAEQAAQYDVGKAHDMLGYKSKNGNLLGWETQFYQKPAEQGGGFGPDLFDAVKSKTVPSAASPTGPAYSMQNPAKPATVAEAQALPSGTPFMTPSGKIIVKH